MSYLDKLWKTKMRWKSIDDTFAYIYGTHNPNKKRIRKWTRKSLKQEKFYNGFDDFLDSQRYATEKRLDTNEKNIE